MTRHTRRGALAVGASALAALAGCSSLPFTGDDGSDDLPAYDEFALADAVRDDTLDASETYPGPVPVPLLETHRDRGLDLLDSVPRDPSFPNEAVSDRLRAERERVAEGLPDDAGDSPTLEDVREWRDARQQAAEVAFAYRAAAGGLDVGDLERRRVRVRDAFRAVRSERPYVGADPVDALAVGFELESAFADVRQHLAPDESFPAEPASEPFHAGDAAARVEAARAHLDTAVGLREAHGAPGMTDYWHDVAAAAGHLAEVRRATTERVAPFLFDDPEPGDVLDDAGGTDIDLLRYGLVAATTARDNATSARNRGDYATAVVYTARALADTLATGRAIDAIRSGATDIPADAPAVTAERDAAKDALREATSKPPSSLAALTVAPTVRRFQYADDRLRQDPTDRTVARESARYTYVSFAADAVPRVVDRVARELGVDGE